MENKMCSISKVSISGKFFLIGVFAIMSSVTYAEIKLPAIISDNMVLQADSNVPVWGNAEPQSKIIIVCSWSDAKVAADSDKLGKWMVKIKTPKSGSNCTITITCGQESKTINNILIGEVWLCSGQSNMWWPVKQAKDANYEIAAANYPDIRLFAVSMAASDKLLDDCKGQWVLCNSQTVADFSAVGYFFGRELYKKLNTPIGLINAAYGGTPAQAWIRREIITKDEKLKICFEKDTEIEANKAKYQQRYDQALDKWKKDAESAKAAGKTSPKKPAMPRELFKKNKSSVLYNAMIHPLIPYAIKGVIWYQGESNASESELYRKLFPALITNWRQDWGQGDFPFYYVQLASYGKYMKKTSSGQPDLAVPPDSNWPRLREAQSMTLSLPNTGMAVAMDIGEVDNIHPKNKQDVGKRLALWAFAKDYGFKDIIYSGPLYKNIKIENDKARIYFNCTGSGLMTKGDSIKGFAIAGADKKFVWAIAKIDGDMVLVWSEQVKNPATVRYGWSDWSNGNLYNKEELPALPFRTDDW
jgi:sialate O-acetylesterase